MNDGEVPDRSELVDALQQEGQESAKGRLRIAGWHRCPLTVIRIEKPHFGFADLRGDRVRAACEEKDMQYDALYDTLVERIDAIERERDALMEAMESLARLDSPETKRYLCAVGVWHSTEEGEAHCDAFTANDCKGPEE